MSIWTPRSARPRYKCQICEMTFTESESREYEQHVARCAKAHHDELVSAYRTARPPAFYQAADKEYEAWVRKHGRVG